MRNISICEKCENSLIVEDATELVINWEKACFDEIEVRKVFCRDIEGDDWENVSDNCRYKLEHLVLQQ